MSNIRGHLILSKALDLDQNTSPEELKGAFDARITQQKNENKSFANKKQDLDRAVHQNNLEMQYLTSIMKSQESKQTSPDIFLEDTANMVFGMIKEKALSDVFKNKHTAPLSFVSGVLNTLSPLVYSLHKEYDNHLDRVFDCSSNTGGTDTVYYRKKSETVDGTQHQSCANDFERVNENSFPVKNECQTHNTTKNKKSKPKPSKQTDNTIENNKVSNPEPSEGNSALTRSRSKNLRKKTANWGEFGDLCTRGIYSDD